MLLLSDSKLDFSKKNQRTWRQYFKHGAGLPSDEEINKVVIFLISNLNLT